MCGSEVSSVFLKSLSTFIRWVDTDLTRLADKSIFYRGVGDGTQVLMIQQQALDLLNSLVSSTCFQCSQGNSVSPERTAGVLPACYF